MTFTPEQRRVAHTIGRLVGYQKAMVYILKLLPNQHVPMVRWGFVLMNNEVWWYVLNDTGKVAEVTQDALSTLHPQSWKNYVKYAMGEKRQLTRNK